LRRGGKIKKGQMSGEHEMLAETLRLSWDGNQFHQKGCTVGLNCNSEGPCRRADQISGGLGAGLSAAGQGTG